MICLLMQSSQVQICASFKREAGRPSGRGLGRRVCCPVALRRCKYSTLVTSEFGEKQRCQEGWGPRRDLTAADTPVGELAANHPRCCCCCSDSHAGFRPLHHHHLHLHHQRRRRRLALCFTGAAMRQLEDIWPWPGFNSIPTPICGLIVAAPAPPSVIEVALSRNTPPPLAEGESRLPEQSRKGIYQRQTRSTAAAAAAEDSQPQHSCQHNLAAS